MLIILAVWLVVIPAAWAYGKPIAGDYREDPESVVCRVYTGLLMIAAVLFAISLYRNLAWWIGLLIVIPGLLVALLNRDVHRERVPILLAVALGIPVAMWCAAREVSFYDTALYHQQVVKWLSEFGLVRGLALVCSRYALVSSWFAAGAPINHGLLEGRAPAIVGSIPIVLMVVPDVFICRALLARKTLSLTSTTWVAFSLALAAVSLLYDMGNSLSPDMMAWLAPGVVTLLLSDEKASNRERTGRALLAATLAFIAKVSVAPVLACCVVLVLFRSIRNKTSRLGLLAYSAAAVGLIALYLSANTIASGCPIFPSPFSCLSYPWTVSKEFAIGNLAGIVAYNTSGRYNHSMALLLSFALIPSIFLIIFRRADSFVRTGLILSWSGLVFVFVMAPVPRYGMGYFVLPVALACGALAESVQNRMANPNRGTRRARVLTFPSSGLWVSLAGLGAAACLLVPGTRDHLILPFRMAAHDGDMIHIKNQTLNVRRPLSLRSHSFGDIDIWMPRGGDQCWDAALPCSAEVSSRKLGLRRPAEGFAGGFARIGVD